MNSVHDLSARTVARLDESLISRPHVMIWMNSQESAEDDSQITAPSAEERLVHASSAD